MLRRETYEDGVLVASEEVRDDAGTIVYERFDGDGVSLELRDATAQEAEALALHEARESRFAADDRLSAAVAVARSWAQDATNTTVTSGNAVATLQTVVNRLGVFFDNFADLLVSLQKGSE